MSSSHLLLFTRLSSFTPCLSLLSSSSSCFLLPPFSSSFLPLYNLPFTYSCLVFLFFFLFSYLFSSTLHSFILSLFFSYLFLPIYSLVYHSILFSLLYLLPLLILTQSHFNITHLPKSQSLPLASFHLFCHLCLICLSFCSPLHLPLPFLHQFNMSTPQGMSREEIDEASSCLFSLCLSSFQYVSSFI